MSTIRAVTAGDLSRVTRTIMRAFVDDPVMRWLFPDDDDYERDQPSIGEFMAREWLALGTAWCTDDVVAIAGWLPPGRPDVQVERPAVVHPAWRVERLRSIRPVLDAHTPPEPHWYLNILATHPDWQRQGLGGAVMNVVFDMADAAGLPCYLETETTANVAYYRHHGFEVRSEWDLGTATDSGPHMWGMFRPHRG